jgi:Tol biopolymer transport system component/tRNA A-37 threonylcarbamoyl transferase component Bud32
MTDVLDRLTRALSDRYRIERGLGAGGMATVYLAEDLKHDRKVAIKVLRPELAAVIGAERFLQEIRTTANLQHPHILPLHDSGEADGLVFYVMPYVEGESLRARLSRERQLPVDEAVRIAREVADALDYAHRKGIVHRDIKPENVLLHDGRVLVVDFGIALAVSRSEGGARLTETGMSLGTPHYMSPEQAMGEREITAKSDVYALGCVLYEMLTGEPPFDGPTAQAIIAKTLTEKPSVPSAVRDTVPASLDAAVLKALARLPADRFATAAAFATAVGLTGEAMESPGATREARPTRRVLAVVGALAVAAGAFAVGRSTGDARLGRGWDFGQATQVTWEPGLEIAPAISPDGKQVAYASGDGTRSRVFVTPVAGGRAVPLTDDSMAVETHPQWSRDGSRILFLKNGQVFSAPAGGGPARQEVPGRGGDVETATWSPDEQQIAYAIDDTLFIRDAAGTSRLITMLFQPSLCTWGPSTLIACTSGNRWYLKAGMAFGNLAPSWIVVIDPATGQVTAVTDSNASSVAPRWVDEGRTLLYASNRLGPPDIYAVPITSRGSSAGVPQRLTVGLGVNSFSLSADGSRLAYAVMITSSSIWSRPWVGDGPDRAARPTQLTFGQQTIERCTVSEDGAWLYYDSDASGNPDLYRLPLPRGRPERLTSERTAEFAPDLSPDGRILAFHSWRTGSRDIFLMPLDGGPIEQVTDSPEQEQHPQWSPDGRRLAFVSQSQPLGVFVSERTDGARWETRKLVDQGQWAAWSPDGEHLSYVTDVLGGGLRVVHVGSGQSRVVYDETLPGAPLAETSEWSADGRTIYFKSHDADGDGVIWSVPSSGGTPRRLLKLGDGRLRSDRYGFAIGHGQLYYTLYDRQSNIWMMDVRP